MISKFLKKILKEPEGLWVCVGLLAVLGIVILQGLKSDLFPPLNFPSSAGPDRLVVGC